MSSTEACKYGAPNILLTAPTQKSESRISKSETNPNLEIQMLQTPLPTDIRDTAAPFGPRCLFWFVAF
jgi:hypothetical protein